MNATQNQKDQFNVIVEEANELSKRDLTQPADASRNADNDVISEVQDFMRKTDSKYGSDTPWNKVGIDGDNNSLSTPKNRHSSNVAEHMQNFNDMQQQSPIPEQPLEEEIKNEEEGVAVAEGPP